MTGAELDFESQLLRVFRLLSEDARAGLMLDAVQRASKWYSVDIALHAYANRDEAWEDEQEMTLDERLLRALPPHDLWEYMDDWMHPTLEAVFSERIAEVVFGAPRLDEENARQLIDEIGQVAARESFPTDPYFTVEDGLEFIGLWREQAIQGMERHGLERRTEENTDDA